jgi:hypothetical protein
MKNLKSKIETTIVIFYFLIISQSGYSQSTYFEEPVSVPIFGETITSNTQKFVYSDLSEISSNRLDLVAGVTQTGFDLPFVYYFTNGNWYKNENNTNFNAEVTNNRFIYQDTSLNFNGINGLLFAKLNSTASINKEVVATRALDNKLYVFLNNEGVIAQSFTQSFIVNGSVAAVGKFTNDTLEDVAVISGGDLNIYKNLGNSTLDTVPVFTLQNVNAEKVIITQVSNYIYPYSIINNSTGDRDEIIIQSGNTIRIYKNNNNNGISDSTIISINGGFASDFKLSDVNNDGWNDLVAVSFGDGIKVFNNNSGTVSSSASYTNTNYSSISTIALADFNKDGWNDILISNNEHIYLFLNQFGSYSQSASDDEEYYSFPYYFYGKKLEIADLQNKGGLTVLSSLAYLNIDHFDSEALGDNNASIQRFNASDTDAVPAPPLLFKDLVLIGQHYRPRLHIFNRGDRDFQKYIIYKKSPNFNNNNWFLYDSSNTSGDYIDDAEAFNEGGLSDPPPPDNLFYYVKAQDNSYQASISSDTIGYPTTVCPGCAWEAGDNFTVNNISSKRTSNRLFC